MTLKQAYLVLGAESTGTRYVTRLLIAGGCIGDAEHRQRWDDETPAGEPVVLRRSVPHADQERPGASALAKLFGADYRTMAVVTWRDWQATAQSQAAARHVGTVEAAYPRMRRAYEYLLRFLADSNTPWIGVSYEALADPEARVSLGKRLRLPHPERLREVEFLDGNPRHFAGAGEEAVQR